MYEIHYLVKSDDFELSVRETLGAYFLEILCENINSEYKIPKEFAIELIKLKQAPNTLNSLGGLGQLLKEKMEVKLNV